MENLFIAGLVIVGVSLVVAIVSAVLLLVVSVYRDIKGG